MPRPRRTPAWLSDPQRRLIEELNSQLLHGMLRHAEVTDRSNVRPGAWILDQLRGLEVSARLRLAKVPFVLLDASFTNGDLWMTERLGHSFTPLQDSAWIDGYDLHVLARALFTYAWRFTHDHTDAARIVFGMSKQTSEVFAELSLRELERIILQRGHWVRPRWEFQPERWSKLLNRAQRGNSAILDQRALQLLYGDLFVELP